jgi:hypothetical protein
VYGWRVATGLLISPVAFALVLAFTRTP